MGLGLQGAYGAKGFTDKLEDIVARQEAARLEAEIRAQREAQQRVENDQRNRQLLMQEESNKLLREGQAQSRKDLESNRNVEAINKVIDNSAPEQDLTDAMQPFQASDDPRVQSAIKGLKTNANIHPSMGPVGIRLMSPKVTPPEPTPTPEPLEDVIDPKTGKPVKVKRSEAAGMQPFVREGNDRLVPVEGPDGKPILVPESQAGGMKPATPRRSVLGAERVALSFYNRMSEAMADMDATEDLLSAKDLLIIHEAPSWLSLITNKALSVEGQRYAQALKKFTEARLRKESGAAIPISEFKNDRDMIAKKYGDSPEVTMQKRATRDQTADGVAFQSGQAYEEFYGEPFKRRDATNAPRSMPPVSQRVAGKTTWTFPDGPYKGKTGTWNGTSWDVPVTPPATGRGGGPR